VSCKLPTVADRGTTFKCLEVLMLQAATTTITHFHVSLGSCPAHGYPLRAGLEPGLLWAYTATSSTHTRVLLL
jgi:hypothetical protein